MTAYRNTFIRIDKTIEEIDLSQKYSFDWGYNFYFDVLRKLDSEPGISGFTFYIAYTAPETLPAYGDRVVLLVIGDEFYPHKAYFRDIACILCCYSRSPVYLDSFPIRQLQRSAFLHYAFKTATRALSVLRVIGKTGRTGLADARRKTLHIPIAFFSDFDPEPKPMTARTINYAFLGSLAFDDGQNKWLHHFVTPPKILARRQMLEAIKVLTKDVNGHLHTTAGFEQSILNKDGYAATLANTRISLVPRGTSYETYRFFESCKAGCVIICEPLPREWCYEGHPGIIIRDWNRLPDLVKSLLADEKLMEQKSQAAIAYCRNRCSDTAVSKHIGQFMRRILPANECT